MERIYRRSTSQQTKAVVAPKKYIPSQSDIRNFLCITYERLDRHVKWCNKRDVHAFDWKGKIGEASKVNWPYAKTIEDKVVYVNMRLK